MLHVTWAIKASCIAIQSDVAIELEVQTVHTVNDYKATYVTT